VKPTQDVPIYELSSVSEASIILYQIFPVINMYVAPVIHFLLKRTSCINTTILQSTNSSTLTTFLNQRLKQFLIWSNFAQNKIMKYCSHFIQNNLQGCVYHRLEVQISQSASTKTQWEIVTFQLCCHQFPNVDFTLWHIMEYVKHRP